MRIAGKINYPIQQQKPLKENTAAYCFIGEIDLPKTGDGILVVGDECEEEIVVCNNYQPPKFEDVGTITVLGENDPWQWIDDQGSNQTTNAGTACDESRHASCDSVNFGKTYLMQKIGKFSTGSLIYNLTEDIQISTCLDQRDTSKQVWLFNVGNIRVPIFTSFCPEEPNNCGWINFGDGTDSVILNQYVSDCVGLDSIMEALKWWRIGPYHNAANKKSYPFNALKIFFSAGIIAHENQHVNQDSSSLFRFMNGNDSGLVVLMQPPYTAEKENYPCPEEAISRYQKPLRNRISGMLRHATNLHNFSFKEKGQWKFELNADKSARNTYDIIKQNIIDWAKTKSWWCNNSKDCFKNDCNP